VETIANRDNPVHGSLTGFLNDNELLNGVFNNEPQMGVSIKILHRFIQKVRDKFSKLETPFYHSLRAESRINFPRKKPNFSGRKRHCRPC